MNNRSRKADVPDSLALLVSPMRNKQYSDNMCRLLPSLTKGHWSAHVLLTNNNYMLCFEHHNLYIHYQLLLLWDPHGNFDECSVFLLSLTVCANKTHPLKNMFTLELPCWLHISANLPRCLLGLWWLSVILCYHLALNVCITSMLLKAIAWNFQRSF